jgi:arginyl-tRNA synthetase
MTDPLKTRLWEAVRAGAEAVLEAAESDAPLPDFVLEPPRSADHGDFAANIAMLLAKPLRRPPREIAQAIAERLGDAGGLVSEVEVAGPGFLNLRISDTEWQRSLPAIVKAGAGYGRSEHKTQRVQVEFVSANPTGPLTLGHGRQAIIGDCIARLLELQGHRVTREYYFNDGGRQMRVLGASVRARYLEQLGRAAPPPAGALADADVEWPESIGGLPVCFPRDGYQGDYIGEIAADLVSAHADSLVDEPPQGLFRQAAQERIFAEIRATLQALGVAFDEYYNETTLYREKKLDEAVADLRALGLVYEADEATWLKATEFGLDRDRVLIKSTGEPTYLLPDIAYHREKFRRGFDMVIDVQGADHIEQFPFVREAAAALGCDRDAIELVMHQFVTLTRGGEQVKQSTRRATYVTVDELIGEVGSDVFRFFMVGRKAEGHLDFDLDLARDQDWKKNPAFYVQYAFARTHGIERKAREAGVSIPQADFDPAPLRLPEELELIKLLLRFPGMLDRSARLREPHHVAYYLREVAGAWNPYIQDGSRHRVLSDDPALTRARLGLCHAVRHVLGNGLRVLGVGAPERM